MRLRTDGRSWLELACRAGVFALLGFLIFRALYPRQIEPDGVSLASIGELETFTCTKQPHIHFALESTPTFSQRAWLNALRSAGSAITWSGDLRPLAVVAKPNALPERSHTISGYSRGDSVFRVRDGVSLIDSSVSRSGFVSLPIAAATATANVVAGNESASVDLADSIQLRNVLVIGKAGWETKFILAALEEAGWKTDAQIFVAPSVSATPVQSLPLDTAHYSAVIAVDESAAPRAAEINAFVRTGGGLILGQTAARLQNFAPLRVSLSPPELPGQFPVPDTTSRSSAPFTRLEIPGNAVALEQRGRGVAVAAMRVGFGRVVQIGFSDTWRWRMQGSQQSLVDHRDWWSGLVSSVAYAPVISAASTGDRTPYADFVSVAGQPTVQPGTSKTISDPANEIVWLILIAGLLLTEWTSRRMRGAA